MAAVAIIPYTVKHGGVSVLYDVLANTLFTSSSDVCQGDYRYDSWTGCS